MDSNEQNTNQTEAMYQQPVVENKHFSTLRIVIVLVITAIVLGMIIGATNKMHRDTDNFMPEGTTGSEFRQDEMTQESDAIRAELEASNTDGVSEGL